MIRTSFTRGSQNHHRVEVVGAALQRLAQPFGLSLGGFQLVLCGGKPVAHGVRQTIQCRKTAGSSVEVVTLTAPKPATFNKELANKGKAPENPFAIDTANALADSLMSRYTPENTEIVDINDLKAEKQKIRFTKMSACSNDYIYVNCFDPANRVSSPESDRKSVV